MTTRCTTALTLLACSLFFRPNPASAQGVIVDRRAHVPVSGSYQVKEVIVDARVRDQVAEVQVSQTFHNPGSFVLEAEYLFPLPDEGALQNFVLMVDGKELPGRLLPKDEARRIYEQIVRAKKDPALLEYLGCGLFRTSVFPIPPGADRKVTLRYTQLCRRDREVVEFAYPFATQKFTAKPVQRVALSIVIDSREPIKSVYSPSHGATIQRTGDRQARVQLEQRDLVPTSDFRLLYTLADGAIGASLISYRPNDSDDGYFLLLASPEVKTSDTKPQPKSVIFVLDRSGSMSGKKIEQAKKALQFVLDNLREGDTFNILVYDDRIESFKPELQRYSKEVRAEVARFIENIHAGGSTNIDGALRTALGMLHDDSRPSYVLFLTDGLPTAGEQREQAIAENAKNANKVRARLFTFGVGFDVNARLLDRLSGGNAGTSEFVRPDEDIEAHVARFYSKMTSPVLAGIQIELGGSDVNRTYPRDIPDLFEGGQLVWVGRYRQAGKVNVRITGKIGSETKSIETPAELAPTGQGTTYEFVEKIWAMRRIGFIIDQIDLHGKNKELIDELVALSTKHGILTAYTAFLADERVQLHARVQNFERTQLNLRRLDTVDGAAGLEQRSSKTVFSLAEQVPQTAASTPGLSSRLGRERALSSEALGGRGDSMGGGLIVKDAEGHEKVVTTVRQIGNKTFYRKNDRWIDAEVTLEEEKNATEVRQFSDEFFNLLKSLPADQSRYFTFTEPITVRVGDKVIRVEMAK